MRWNGSACEGIGGCSCVGADCAELPGADPVGKRIAWTGDILRFTPISPEWRTIVGVVGTTQDGGPDATPQPAMFMPFAQEVPTQTVTPPPIAAQISESAGFP